MRPTPVLWLRWRGAVVDLLTQHPGKSATLLVQLAGIVDIPIPTRGLAMSDSGHRSRMRDHAVILHKLLKEHRRITLGTIARELGASELTARRWIDCFSRIMPLRLERGVVINEHGRW